MNKRKTQRPTSQPPARKRVLFLPCYRDERMLQGICEFAYAANWELETYYYHTGFLPKEWDGDGIITMLHVPGHNQELTAFIRRHNNIPTVDLSRNNELIELPCVLQDNPKIGAMGAEHFAHAGLQDLGFLLHTTNHFHEERYHGFRNRARELNLPCSLIQITDTGLNSHTLPDWFVEQAREIEGPIGVMAAADYLAQWTTRACAATGLRIPDDVALLGVDNSRAICELSPIALSSVDNNGFRHGYEAAKLLAQMMRGNPPKKKVIRIPAGALHVRASSNIMAISHPHVATALHYIAEHYADPELTPERVAARVPMSKRRLHDAFTKYIGRSIYQEITHRRIQRAIKQIQTTDQKLWDIAENAGFRSPEVMSRLFRRQLGHPPSEYRKPS